MKSQLRKVTSFLFDPRVIVVVFGVTLSIVTHELLHVVMHLGDISEVGIFPDRHAIVEIIFEPSTVYNLAVEEGIAYAVTMITLILTAMLVGDINDAHDTRSVQQIIFSKDTGNHGSATQKKRYRDRLARVLGITATNSKDSRKK